MRLAVSLMFASLLPIIAWAADPGPNDMVNNPPYANWSAFKPGTKVTLKEPIKLADGSRVEVTTTSKLLRKTKEKVEVETTVKGSANGAVESQTTVTAYPAMVKMSDVDTPDDKLASVTEGKEEVDYKGKKIETEWIEATSAAGDTTTIQKMWTGRDIPGGIVKETITQKKGDQVTSESVTELVEFK